MVKLIGNWANGADDNQRKRIQRAEHDVVKAVGELYDIRPPVRRFIMKRMKGRIYRCDEYGEREYCDEWMNDILNAYAKLMRVKRKIREENNK